MAGNSSTMSLPTKKDVFDFIGLYKSALKKNQRVKITCDILGIDGYLQGTKPIRDKFNPSKINNRCGFSSSGRTIFFYLFYKFTHHTS